MYPICDPATGQEVALFTVKVYNSQLHMCEAYNAAWTDEPFEVVKGAWIAIDYSGREFMLMFSLETMSPGIVAHECCHGAHSIVDRFEYTNPEDREEDLCMYTEILVNKTYEILGMK